MRGTVLAAFIANFAWIAALAAPFEGLAAGAQGSALEGEAIILALSARSLALGAGGVLDFKSNGRVLSGQSWGSWRVQGDRLCLEWSAPPAAGLAAGCYQIARTGHIDLRFMDHSGSYGARYNDLN